jgi:peroxiredoxin
MLRDSTFHDDALLELVLLKNLYDNFYTNSFSREGLLSLVKEIEAATPYVEHKRIAQNIIRKVTLLMPGYAPPDFALYDTDGKLYHLSDFRGKALYLIFCRVFNYSVLNAFEKLVILHNIYGDAVEIAVISADDDFASLKDFCTRERYRWPFLHYGNDPEVLKRYDIKALPTYFILDKDGKLMLSPAPSPLDDLEGLFMEIHAQAHRQ